ncbi:LysR family transcriptional regulator [Microbacterium sp.]|uniref:LysR family transcriptional regulator n=1 Tax=Microbacterium sp. TaxID=51671 RepID=UPI0025E73011|nr:LysR family transcriptional regulator [Microbacterium sp.]
MKLADLRRFVAVAAADLHFPRATDALGISLASLYASMARLEAEVGHPLMTRDTTPWSLTPAGTLLLEEANRRISDAPAAPAAHPKGATGGKARASKGAGRAPIVKGQPKPYKKRQGR